MYDTAARSTLTWHVLSEVPPPPRRERSENKGPRSELLITVKSSRAFGKSGVGESSVLVL